MHVQAPPIAASAARPRFIGRVPRGIAYLGVLVLFVVFAFAATSSRPRALAGLADDPDVQEAGASVRGGVALRIEGLRLRSSLLGGDDVAMTSKPTAAGMARAAAQLERARARRPLDPRVASACATLDLARGRLDRAERRFRSALAAGAPYPEARLLLGATLVERARHEAIAPRARGLELQAIAQFAAVPEDAPEYPPALYNRALLLARVGRADEARVRAREYFALDPGSPWAARLAREVARGG